MGVANGSREMESCMGVAKMNRKDELQRGGHENKKFRGVCNGYPKGSNKLIKNNVQNK